MHLSRTISTDAISLRKDRERDTVVQRVVEPQTLVQAGDGLDLVLGQIEGADVQILRQTALVVALGDDSHATLRGPPQQHLRGRLVVLLCNALHMFVVEEERGLLGGSHVELEEGLRAEGGVGGDGDLERPAQVQEILLDEVWVMLDLEGLREVLGVALDVEEQGAVVVADADVLDQTLLVQLLHRTVGVLERSLGGAGVAVLVGPAGRVADRGVDVFDGDREVDHVEIEVFDAVVLELLLADWLDLVVVMLHTLSMAAARSTGVMRLTKEFQSLETMKSSSRLTRPSLIARAKPSPASFSLP